MSEFFPIIGQWIWFVVAGVLLIAELTVPGVFFIWFALAALAVGLVDLVVALNWQMELVLFAVLALISVFAGRAFMNRRDAPESDLPNLIRRMYDYVGKVYSLPEPIVDGRGRLSIDGTLWDIRGPDAAQGLRVRVTGVDGLKLNVEPVQGTTQH